MRAPSDCARPDGSPCVPRSGRSLRCLRLPQEMRIELVEIWRHDIEVLECRPRRRGAAQQLDLVLRRGVDLDDMAVQPPAGRARWQPRRYLAWRKPGNLQPDPGRQPREVAQVLDRAVGDLDAAVHDDDAPCTLFELGERMR